MRFVSLTFDDGFSRGAEEVAAILNRFDFKATFFIVTGWVEPMTVRSVHDPCNRGRPHGNWPFWKSLACMGHEIGSHTHSHINASGKLARFWPGLLNKELKVSSAQIEKAVGIRPSSVSLPWNAWLPYADQLIRRYYSTCVVGQNSPVVNSPANNNLYKANAWAPKSSVNPHEVEHLISSLEDNEWLIFQYHSIGEEGFEPISKRAFEQLCNFLSTQPNLYVTTVKNVANYIVASRSNGGANSV
jgi:peptidoglycan/xylan/chitin deacetylase (PgdA/CDA1 family)